MRPATLARFEQTQVLSLIRQALRDAVAAPNDSASMDVAAAAQVAVADLVREEVHHV